MNMKCSMINLRFYEFGPRWFMLIRIYPTYECQAAFDSSFMYYFAFVANFIALYSLENGLYEK